MLRVTWLIHINCRPGLGLPSTTTPPPHHPDCEIPIQCRLQRSRPWACLRANHRTLYWLQAAFESLQTTGWVSNPGELFTQQLDAQPTIWQLASRSFVEE